MSTTKERLEQRIDGLETEVERLLGVLESLGYEADGALIDPKPVRRWMVHFRDGVRQEVHADVVDFGDMSSVTTFEREGAIVAKVFSDAVMIGRIDEPEEADEPEPELAMMPIGTRVLHLDEQHGAAPVEDVEIDIRFSAEAQAAIEALARYSGLTPAQWVQSVVEQNVVRRSRG